MKFFDRDKKFEIGIGSSFTEKGTKSVEDVSKYKILLDTDLGDDIDDVLAIALGMSLPEVEFVGITTVFRNTNMRARLAKKLTMDGGFHIPVYAGSGDGIKAEYNKPRLCQYTPELDEERYAPVNEEEGCNGEQAIDFIIETCEKYGKELIVLAIGPLTNIAKAILKKPNVFDGVKQVVIMGGTYFLHHVEWNIKWDVEAADIVFNTVSNLACVGWDTTSRVQFNQKQTDFVLNYTDDTFRGYCAKLVKLWIEKNHYLPILHDPLALYYCIDTDIAKMERAKVKVITQGAARGMTLNLQLFDDSEYNRDRTEVLVSNGSEREKFVKIFLKRVFGYEDR